MGEGDAGSADARLIAGRSLARHQLDFALALGCDKVILFGHGATPQAFALRHAAEAAGVQVQLVRGVRDLPAAVRGDDHLLVLAQGLLPDSTRAFELLRNGDGVLVLPAEAGWGAGFERLDLATAWGGAMVLPGRAVATLDELPEDAEPIAGLLRIGRQAGVVERPLPESELAEGRWQIVRGAEAARAAEPAWVQRRLPPAPAFRPTAWLAHSLVRRFGSRWMGTSQASAALGAAAVVLSLSALAIVWFGAAAAAFALLVPAALAIELGNALGHVMRSIFVPQATPSRVSRALHLMWDAAFLAAGVLAIDGSRAHRLFAPLVLTGLLHVSPPWPKTGWRALAGDRGILALLLAVAATLGLTEGGFMVISLALLALRLASPADERG
jgi:hypothetical protein